MLAGRFRIVALLGRGGMGEVYRAEDLKLGQPVALKFLPEPIDEARLQLFYREVRVGREVAHPNVCRIYDLVEADGRHFLAMEYVDGEDLASLLRRIGRLPVDKALDLARGICGGLAASHEKGVLHRDLKPANVMVDGRGQPRITDFGLAAPPGDTGADSTAGTPAYMAPEQLAGQPASVRSDVYALGLVLYEMFTGRRRFEASTLRELLDLHREAGPPSLSGVRDLEPAVERVVVRCLEEDPAARPPSVRAILAALPGGDPLQAAIDAGETPSPAMVAAAGTVGDLSVGRAWASLAATLIGLLLVPLAAKQFLLLRRLPLPKPPEVLAERAREVAGRFGYRQVPFDTAIGFAVDDEQLAHVAGDPSPLRWEALASRRPSALSFMYRQSPRSLVAGNEERRVLRRDPPLDVPGMLEVSLDPDGRLLGFAAVPPAVGEQGRAGREPDWTAAFAEAGLDRAAFTPVEAVRTAPVDTDLKAAWEITAPQPLRIDAASHNGRIVWWSVQGPWARPDSEVADAPAARRGAEVLFFVFLILLQAGGVFLARRNLRAGRGDRRGAQRLAAGVFAAALMAGLLRADHGGAISDEYDTLVTLTAYSLFWSAFAWVIYAGLEPHVRRRWPHMLISWNRLLAGRWHDPMVGRDVLLGGLAGIALGLLVVLVVFSIPAWLGLPAARPRAQVLTPLISVRHMLFFVASSVPISIMQAMSVPGILLILRIVFRSDWAALGGLYVFLCAYTFIQFSRFTSVTVGLAASAMLAGLVIPLVKRSTLLALVAFAYFTRILETAPLTLDLDAWYVDQSLLALGLLAGIAAWSFHVALGGKPPFAGPADE
jgi:protein kinase-like protein